MSYLIQTVLNVAAFIVASVVVNLAMWYVFIETEVVTIVMNLDTLKSFKKGDKINADYKNAFIVKHKEGVGIYKQIDEYLKDMNKEDCEEVPEDLPEPEPDDPDPKEKVATETEPKTEETAGEQ